MVKRVNSDIRFPWIPSRLHHLSVWSFSSYLISLSLGFLICKKWALGSRLLRLMWGSKEIMYAKRSGRRGPPLNVSCCCYNSLSSLVIYMSCDWKLTTRSSWPEWSIQVPDSTCWHIPYNTPELDVPHVAFTSNWNVKRTIPARVPHSHAHPPVMHPRTRSWRSAPSTVLTALGGFKTTVLLLRN